MSFTEICDLCNGEGFTTYESIFGGEGSARTCPECHGRGLVHEDVDGFKIGDNDCDITTERSGQND